MIPTSLVLTNFRNARAVDWSIPEGATALIGPNGSGKSTHLLGIEVALFGAKSRSMAPLLTRGETEMQIELQFEHGADTYRVRRGYSARGSGKTWVTIDARIPATDDGDDAWMPLTKETASETQSAIEQLLGLTRATYRASAYSPQDDGAAWTSADPAERKRILAEILALGSWDDLLAEASTRRKVVHADAVAARREGDGVETANQMVTALDERLGEARAADLLLAGREEGLAARMPELQRAAREAHTAAAQAETRVEAARAAKATADNARAQRDALIGKIDAAHDAVAGIDEASETARHLAGHESALADLVAYNERARASNDDAAREWEESVRVRDAAEQTHTRVVREANLAREVFFDAHDRENQALDVGTCPTCAQALTGAAHEHAVAALREKREQAEAEHLRLSEVCTLADAAFKSATAAVGPKPAMLDLLDATQITEMIARARNAANIVAAAAGWSAQLETMERELEAQRVACSDLDIAAGRAAGMAEGVAIAIVNLTRADEALHVAATEDAEVRRKRIDTSNEVARLTAEHDQALERARAAEAAAARADELEASLNRLALLERAYGRDGVPSLIVETVALPAIQTEANRVLDDLASPFRIDLRAQRQTKSGETRDALDIIIHTPTGEAPYETLSGGEATRVNVALRIGLARLLASRRGAGIGIFAIDEPDGLDQDGADRLAVILKDAARTTFGRVVLVSHQDGLRDALDQTIELTADQTADRQEVAA